MATDSSENLLSELNQKGEIIKNKVLSSEFNKEIKKSIHDGVICDGCKQNPLIGTRYKCSVCTDFDYCEICEETLIHPHIFMKIKSEDELSKLSHLKNSFLNKKFENVTNFFGNFFKKEIDIAVIGNIKYLPGDVLKPLQELKVYFLIKNTGLKAFPEKSVIFDSSNKLDILNMIPLLLPNESKLICIPIKTPVASGSYIYSYDFYFPINENSELEKRGKTINIDFKVCSSFVNDSDKEKIKENAS